MRKRISLTGRYQAFECDRKEKEGRERSERKERRGGSKKRIVVGGHLREKVSSSPFGVRLFRNYRADWANGQGRDHRVLTERQRGPFH